ncbi:MAG TPA: aldehyde dehydrogenase family protein [Phycisphaeraceae bacterium]|nr:aldehyde dehydrogenase family protein [Phycisphaeraceae bacterium]
MFHPLITKLGLDKDPRVFEATADTTAANGYLVTDNPTTCQPLAAVKLDTAEDYERMIQEGTEVFRKWRMIPAPIRGQVVRACGDALRDNKELLGELVSLEMGKIKAEGMGEIQEAIDIADFAVGLSRQLYGLTMHSERPRHRMYEQWHPLGLIGIITAFNFPAAVWAWNSMIAAVCGDVCVWKPSRSTPLVAIAVHNICSKVAADMGHPGIFQLVVGRGAVIGELMNNDRRLPLISATGSCRMGRQIGEKVALRLGRCLLELGGNNAIIVTENADLDMLTRATLFGAVGTAGQRCTSTRRLIVHSSVIDKVINSLVNAYKQVTIGDPLDDSTLMGPLVNDDAVKEMFDAIERAKSEGGEVITGGKMHEKGGRFVEPTIVRVPKGKTLSVTLDETFAPILYIMEYDTLDEAIEMHNGVDQGLSSSIFTLNMREAEQFLSHAGSDCGIANVNIGTSGAEIGGAFGGEKDTGGGRESGSDSWKIYMRRQTCTINWSDELPLAQGISFG